MKFKINNTEWEIQEVNCIEDEVETVGLTRYQERIIYLKNLDRGFMIRTLKHELTHVWLYEYGHNQNDDKTFSYDDVCEIVASSNDFINEIVEQYKNTAKIRQTVDNIYINGVGISELMKKENSDEH